MCLACTTCLTVDGYKLPTHPVAQTAGECEYVPGTASPSRIQWEVTDQFLGNNNSLLPSFITLSVSTPDQLDEVWQEVVVAKSRYYPSIFLKWLRKTTQSLTTSCVPDEIRTEHLQNTSLARYRISPNSVVIIIIT